jgi:hypothetical protein
MSGRSSTVQQTSASEQHRSSANRTNPAATCGDSLQPTNCFRTDFILLDCIAAGDEQGVDLSTRLPKRFVSFVAQPAIRD